MNIVDILVWGFAATAILSTIMAISKPLGLTRMDLPFLLGTMITPSRDRAPFYGFFIHLLIGWIFTALYLVAFRSTGIHTWWFGMAIGLAHALFILTVGLELIGSIHPRMANSFDGPTPTKELQPPGFFSINYGKSTAAVTIFSHLVYGVILGIFL